MGQQQLLLLVLGLVVVSFMVLGGVLMFEENLKKSNSDALIADAIDIATAAQAWKVRPGSFGGQKGIARSNEMDFTGFTFEALSLPDPHITINGEFTFSADTRGLIIMGSNEVHGNKVTMTVDGLTEENIIAVVSQLEEIPE